MCLTKQFYIIKISPPFVLLGLVDISRFTAFCFKSIPILCILLCAGHSHKHRHQDEERSHRHRKSKKEHRDKDKHREHRSSKSSKEQLEIDEANAQRAKLGLPPLK